MAPISDYFFSTLAFLRHYYAVEMAIGVMVVLLINFLLGLWFKKAIGENRSKDTAIEIKHEINPDTKAGRTSFVEFEGRDDLKLFRNKNSLEPEKLTVEEDTVASSKIRESKLYLSHEQFYGVGTRFVSALDRTNFEQLYLLAQWRTFTMGDVIFEEGKDKDIGIYVVADGSVSMHRQIEGSTIKIREYSKRGESFGELMLLDEKPWPFSASAASNCRLVYLPKKLVLEFCMERPKLMVSFVQTTIGRQWRIARFILYEALKALTVHSTHHNTFNEYFPSRDSANGTNTFSSEAYSNKTVDTLKSVPEPVEDLLSYSPVSSKDGKSLKGDDCLGNFLQERRKDRTTHIFLQAGEILKEKGGTYIASMFILLEGKLAVCRDAYGQECVFLPGSLIGAIEHLTSVSSPHAVRAVTTCRLAPIALSQISTEVALRIAQSVSKCLCPVLLEFDALGGHIKFQKAGRLLYGRGEHASEFFIIVSGRIGVLSSNADMKESKDIPINTAPKFLSGRGDWVGEAAFLRGAGREGHSHAAICIRDTEFVAVSDGCFRLITTQYPQTYRRISSMLAARLHEALGAKMKERNISTVALLPISPSIKNNLEIYSERLSTALNSLRIGRVMQITSEKLDELLGRSTRDLRNFTKRAQVSAWLAELEEQHRFLLLLADPKDTQWTRLCVRTADHILLFAESADPPVISSVERSLFQGERVCRTLADTELVLLHPPSTFLPKNTASWLRPRQRLKLKVTSVHHVRKGTEIQEKRFWSRIARVLSQIAVGLVLGGGGARGLAHQGVLEACRRMNIPVDFIGGTSQGSFMGALYATYLNAEAMRPSVERFSRKMGNICELLQDATLPIVSYFSGRRFNQTIKQIIGEDVQIEDLWIPFFAITTNVSKHRYMIHRQGSLWKAVRASMSLMEYLPPMVIEGDLLVDGGYLNNLPGDVMKDTFRPSYIIGVDVEGAFSDDLYNPTDFGDELSGFWICYRRMMGIISPFTPRLRMPKFTELISAVEFINNSRNILHLRESGDLDLYIKPKLANTNLLDYHKLDQIEKIGFEAAHQQLNEKRDRLPKAFILPPWEFPGEPMKRTPKSKKTRRTGHHRHKSGEAKFSNSIPNDYSYSPSSSKFSTLRRQSDILQGSMHRSKSSEGLKDNDDESKTSSRRVVGFSDGDVLMSSLSRSHGDLTRNIADNIIEPAGSRKRDAHVAIRTEKEAAEKLARVQSSILPQL
ncbi:hypothetical protein AAMO2058_000211700 [Amorphochlora amoebiformis]